MTANERYRIGVGGMIFNKDKKILMAQRIVGTSGTLQMPQGGLKPREPNKVAIAREVYEEIGVKSFTIVREASKKYSYRFPSKAYKRIYGGKYVGQMQTWFLLYFYGEDSEIDLCKMRKQEFISWRWVDVDEVVESTIKFKKALYSEILTEFREDIMNYRV